MRSGTNAAILRGGEHPARDAYIKAKERVIRGFKEYCNEVQIGNIEGANFPFVCCILEDIHDEYYPAFQYESKSVSDHFPEFANQRPLGSGLIWWGFDQVGIDRRLKALDAAIADVNKLIP